MMRASIAHRPAPMLLALLLLLAPAALRADDAEDDRCGDKLKKKDVTVYEMELTFAQKALDEIRAEHGVDLEEVAVETVQADRNVVKEARVQAARRGCPYVVVGEQEERVVGIRYESGRAGSAALPVEDKVYRALVLFARPAASDAAPTDPAPVDEPSGD